MAAVLSEWCTWVLLAGAWWPLGPSPRGRSYSPHNQLSWAHVSGISGLGMHSLQFCSFDLRSFAQNCSFKRATVSYSLSLLFIKECPWANRSCCFKKKRYVSNLIVIRSFDLKKRAIRSKNLRAVWIHNETHSTKDLNESIPSLPMPAFFCLSAL